MIVIFFREGMFYPIDLPPGYDSPKDIEANALCNPGTLRVEDIDGNILWEPTKQ